MFDPVVVKQDRDAAFLAVKNKKVDAGAVGDVADGRALVALVREHEAGVYRLALSIVGEAAEASEITQETAMAYSSHRGAVGRGIDMIKSARGEATTDIGKLEIDKAYTKMI